MIDIGCDRCGKRYRIDETRMKGETARVKCKSCGNPITVTKPQDAQTAESIFAEPPPAAPASGPQPGAARPRAAAAASKPKEPEVLPDADTAADPLYAAEKPRFGLFGKTLIVMLLVSVLPFGLFWFLTFRETSERIRGDSELLLAQTGKGIADQMDAWVNANFAVLRTIAKLPDTVAMARERQDPVLQAVSREYPWMYLVFTVAASGANIARSDGQPLVPYGDRQYFKDVMAGKAMSWQTVVGRTSNVPALVIAVPIRDDGRVVGVLAAAMTVEDISKQVATWKRGATGYAFLIDEKGNAIAHPSAQVAQKRENLNATPLIAEFRRKGWTTLTTLFTAPNGQSALGHARSNNLGWVLALQQEEREVFDSLNVLQNFALALLAVTALLAAAIAWFSARAIAKPVMKLTDAAERMSLGDLNVRIDVRSGDEIGLLAQAIGRMQTSLRMAMERLRKRRSA